MTSAGSAAGAPRRRACFKRPARLVLNRDFQQVFAMGRTVTGRFMVMWVGDGAETGGSVRMGVIASKRTFRRAVDRHRAKRLVREAFRRERETLRGPVDLVVVARRRILDATGVLVREEFRRLAGSAGLTMPEGGTR